MKLLNFCNKLIEYSFYALFFFVPLVFSPSTSELFELNKMWLTFGLTIVIVSAWGIKALKERQMTIQRTPLDIPLLLFGLSQAISTLISLDQRTSFWGYYSRFNGGLLSTICYILLYYAYASNLQLKHTYKVIIVSLMSGFIVALWGLPAHFGKDPTCFLIRHTFDVSCWTDQFQPTVRIFATLGQPAWLASYLALLIPLSISLMFLEKQPIEKHLKHEKRVLSSLPTWLTHPAMLGSGVILTLLFYLDLIYANTRAGFLAFWIANGLFWAFFLSFGEGKQKKLATALIMAVSFLVTLYAIVSSKYELFWLISVVGVSIAGLFLSKTYRLRYGAIALVLLIITFFAGTPFPEINKYATYASLQKQLASTPPVTQTSTATPATTSGTVLESGGTESSSIRRIVWKGALDAWLHNPIFGTGTETFAFAYYQYRPAEHNLTSEWDYLYNKAHNEYLNYLATTGLFGLGTYLLFILWFLFLTGKWLMQEKKETPIRQPNFLLVTGLLSGFVTILIANFFGFSVVITNLYLFLIPLFVFHLLEKLPSRSLNLPTTQPQKNGRALSPYQWTGVVIILIASFSMLLSLYRFWVADTQYALGHNYDTVGQYALAQPLLLAAVKTRPNEPVFTDELAINDASLAIALLKEKGKDGGATASTLAEQAIQLSTQAKTDHPNNILVWKNRVRTFYLLSQANQNFYQQALESIQKAHTLAPTDAKISYNLGVLYGQTGQFQQAIDTLKQTLLLKPDYRDTYFAMGLFYHELASKDGKVIKPEYEKLALESFDYILTHFDPTDKQVKDTLKSWGEK
ncbi:hypothetical protein BH11PAT1_BH11PAT1_1760 [soil metagenome]